MLQRRVRDADEMTRRELILAAARRFLGLGLLSTAPRPAAAAEPATPRRPTAKHVISLFMSGGMSHIDTFDPKPGSDAQGPTRVVDSVVDGIRLGDGFDRLRRLMDRCAIIRSLQSTQGAHEQGRYYVRTGYLQRGGTPHPGLGSWITRLQGRRNRGLPGSVVVGGDSLHPGRGFLAPDHAPLRIGSAAEGLQHAAPPEGLVRADLDRRLALVRDLNRAFGERYRSDDVRAYRAYYDDALRLMDSEDLAAFDLAAEPESVRADYGDTPFAQGCLLARRLVEHGVAHVEVELPGWDTHNDNFDELAELVPALDGPLGALLLDLERRGLLDETLVLVGTEFGRSPRINGNDGRDHHPQAFSCLLAGGGVRGGVVHGATDERGAAVVADAVSIPDLQATVAWAAGLPLRETVHAPDGRPFTVADGGRPVTAIFGGW